MKETRGKARSAPRPPRITRVEVNEKHIKWRFIAFILLLAIGVGALLYALIGKLGGEKGWRTITTAGAGQVTCGDDFFFLYDIGSSGVSASTEYRAITKLYESAARHAFVVFTTTEEMDGVHNLAYLNAHINEEVSVDALLYRALAAMQSAGRREHFGGPIYERYEDIFFCETDADAKELDPFYNDTIAEIFATVGTFATQDAHICVELLGDNRVALRVSDAYLTYAAEEGFATFVDFGWLQNAFIIDYLADTMIENGYSAGTISSRDGYTRNMDTRGTSYAFTLCDRVAGYTNVAGEFTYTGTLASVSLAAYPNGAGNDYYTYADGTVRTRQLAIATGKCQNAAEQLFATSREKGCAALLLDILPYYLSDTPLTHEVLGALTEEGVSTVFPENRVLYCTGEHFTFSRLYQTEDVSYTVHYE